MPRNIQARLLDSVTWLYYTFNNSLVCSFIM